MFTSLPSPLMAVSVLAAALSLTGCSSLPFLPAEAAAALNAPTHVEAYRVGKLDEHPGYGGKVDGFAALKTFNPPPDLARQLAAAAEDPADFRDEERACEFSPTVAWRFYRHLDAGRGQRSVDVLVDFDCDEVMFVARDDKLHEVFRRVISSEPGRGKFLSLARRSFPAENDLESIPAKRPATTEASSP